ncbi:N-acetylmuramoyl-L-alanine amidase LytC precursor [Mobiluncus mulieris]|nr:N-acetylmuramoyl-L-alanine amidase LytC precursor [Mobiluncus mulieris]
MNRYTKMLLAGVASAGLAASMSVFPAVAGDLPYERLAGPSGVETSLAVAKHTWGTDWKVVYVASNRNPVDALPAATIGDGPVVLTDGSTLNLGGVKPGKIVLLGGTGAVPQAIEDQAKATGAEVVRLAGANRYETAFAIAQQAKGQKSGSNVYLASGTALKDAMVADAAKDGVILLSPPNGACQVFCVSGVWFVILLGIFRGSLGLVLVVLSASYSRLVLR